MALHSLKRKEDERQLRKTDTFN